MVSMGVENWSAYQLVIRISRKMTENLPVGLILISLGKEYTLFRHFIVVLQNNIGTYQKGVYKPLQ